MSNSKAIILAAGKGERLGEITRNIPKPMIRINGKPILVSNIEMCVNAGVDEIFINLHHLPEKIQNYIGNGSNFKAKINYNMEKKLLGTAGALLPFEKDLKGATFFVIYGDNSIRFDLAKIKLFHYKKKADITILFHWRKNVTGSGVANFDENSRINEFIEKPKDKISGGWVNSGIYYITSKDIFSHISKGDDFGKNIFPKLIKSNFKIFGIKTDKDLIAIDTPQLLNKHLQKR